MHFGRPEYGFVRFLVFSYCVFVCCFDFKMLAWTVSFQYTIRVDFMLIYV